MGKSGTIPPMGRKKIENREERVPVQIPKNWMVVARKLAADAKQPVLWFLLSCIAEKAVEAEIETPPLPWEVPDED